MITHALKQTSLFLQTSYTDKGEKVDHLELFLKDTCVMTIHIHHISDNAITTHILREYLSFTILAREGPISEISSSDLLGGQCQTGNNSC